MLQVSALLALLFAIVIAIFAVQNPGQVNISFLAWQLQGVAVSVLVLVSAALGAGFMLLLGLAREVRLRLRHRSLNNQLRQAQTRIKQLETTAAQPAAPPSPATSLPEPADTTAPTTPLPLPTTDTP